MYVCDVRGEESSNHSKCVFVCAEWNGSVLPNCTVLFDIKNQRWRVNVVKYTQNLGKYAFC